MVFEGTTGMYEQTSNRERERCAFEIDLNFFLFGLRSNVSKDDIISPKGQV